MSRSLSLYGHKQPKVFFTDNMGDKAFLESVFPSLLEDVIPVDKHRNLPIFEIPEDVIVTEKTTESQINDVIASIAGDLTEDSSTELVVGLDSEWNVSLRKGDPPGPTAILQIAYQKQIYLLHVCFSYLECAYRCLISNLDRQIAKFVREGRLPALLIAFLSNPAILKVGRSVTSDLTRISQEMSEKTTFVGARELGKMAKVRGVVSNARTGLADLCAVTLKCRLPKDSAIRISEDWENPVLSKDQITYAARDVWASLSIYDHLNKIPAPGDISVTCPPHTPVSIWQDDRSMLIAHGHISTIERTPHLQIRGCNVTPTRIVVEVTEILVPGAMLSLHNRLTLADLGPLPFTIVCWQRLLQSRPAPPVAPLAPQHSSVTLASNSAMVTTTPQHSPNSGIGPTLMPPSLPAAASRISDLADEALDLGDDAPPLATHEVDPTGQHLCEEILEEFKDTDWSKVIHSRVLKDAFHFMDLITVPTHHGLRSAYARALRDAIFIPDEEDRRCLSAHLASIGTSWDERLQKDAPWLWARCKRVIPPPEQLFLEVAEVYKTFGPLKDAKTNVPLFNDTAWKASRNALKLIEQGFLSDPPDVPLYYPIGVDEKGLTMYRCVRGTNFTEGAVHRPIRENMPKSGASPRHAKLVIVDWSVGHNLEVSYHFRSCVHLAKLSFP